ncbi:co-chaperone DjlA [Celerinatantimonas diazotrophica]|uniref:Co-chaperone protein DjlA n=1 Tax=Celerinatantimonas diazotrophica TaxID=412034 RepID=A0A4R1KGU0_9GAMM|nr:co-chaperone DjlA [Celerinatantimonas diazotrophica]TCK63263.1 DnaJ like chaperone protein [Celerinatantimonas diazotrophica]CAG9295632.1 Co-chaperone protein DjlA [Celerinatantimonas diazotrophica]
MRILGKIFGFIFGLMFAGWLGAIIGLWLGHMFDRALGQNFNLGSFSSADGQSQFFVTTFAVMGHIAKAKGVVTSQEIQIASMLMDQMGLQGEARQQAQEAFRDGKRSDYPLEQELQKLVKLVRGRSDMLQMFLELQMSGVFADGIIDPVERQMIERVGRALGFSQIDLERVIARWEAEMRFQQRRQSGGHWSHRGAEGNSYSGSSSRDHYESSKQSLSDAYKLLNIEASATDQEVKRAYRRQMSQHHPDKLVSKGLPPQMLELAKKKAQEIQHAYELIKQERGMR